MALTSSDEFFLELTALKKTKTKLHTSPLILAETVQIFEDSAYLVHSTL